MVALLIGPPGCPRAVVITKAEAGEWTPVVLDLALFCAMSAIREGDRVDHARFARLLRHATSGRSWGRPAPVARAQTWLLTEGWRRHGPLAFDEVPGSRT